MNDYMNYIKCGEILKSTSINEKPKYILKCIQCDDHYFLLESFVFPCVNHCDTKTNEEISSEYEVLYEISSDDNQSQEGNEVAGIENHIESENKHEIADADVADPLNLITKKTISDSEMANVNEEDILLESEECLKYMVGDVDECFEGEELTNCSDEVNSECIESDNESIESEDNESTSFVHNFMKSEQSVKSLIAAFKNQPNLWNGEFRLKKKHQKYLEKIRIELKDTLNLQISSNQVTAVITYLYRKYKDYVAYLKTNEQPITKEKNRPVWFFKHLGFLKPFVENNSTEKLKFRRCDLEPQQIIEVLAIYERFPHLWNTNLIENCCKNKRIEALEQMLSAIDSEMGLKMNENGLKDYIHYIHTRFTKEKRRNIRTNDTKPKDRYEYYKHMMFLYDHVGPFKCSECSIELRNPLYFKVHKAQHDGSMPLKCSLCSKEFKILGTYVLHARRHMDDLEEVCKECGKKFINPYELKIHMRFHTGAKPYCCEICGVSFRHIQTFASHKRRHEKKYLHNCPTCSKGFYSKAKMDDHIRSHKQIREFNCKTCGKAFITKKTLQQHQVTHEDVRKHACTLCGKTFKLKVGLTQHMKTHQIYERPDEIK